MNFSLGVQSSARFWSAPAERSGDGAFESLVGEKAKKRQKAGAVQGAPRTAISGYVAWASAIFVEP